MSLLPTLAELSFFAATALVLAVAVYGLIRLVSARRRQDS